MLMAFGLLIILTANFDKFMQVALLVVDCSEWGSLCPVLQYQAADYFTPIASTLFMLTIAIATLRRVSATPISNYWAVFLTLLVFLDHSYLTGFGALSNFSLSLGLFQLAAPWFFMAAVALILLLSFAPDRSTYFMQGYWNADPPLGWALSITSFWLLALSAPKILIIIADSIGNYSLGLAAANAQYKLELLLPAYITAPVIPSVVFTTCVLLLVALGRTSGERPVEKTEASGHRLQTAVQTTRAAQRLNGLKL